MATDPELLYGSGAWAISYSVPRNWEDRQGYGLHYAETLRRWRERYDAAVETGRLPSGFDERFHKLWRYYLVYCVVGFRGGGIHVAQLTLVRNRSLTNSL